ncbi:MAG: glycosyltransferase family 4 protein [Lachnospiraceae bacterium]|nr:glycosyltransferase family 4 protein [Lachnospiraceae bacterium]
MYIPKICGVLGGKLKAYANAPHKYNYRGQEVISPNCFWVRNVFNNPETKYKIFKLSIKKAFIRECKKVQPDVIYALDPTMEGRLAVELKKELNIPVVLIEHSMRKFYNDLYGLGKYEHIYKNVAKRTDAMVYVSSPQKSQFEEITGNIPKSYIVLNGFVSENITTNRKILSEDPIRLICIGYLEERKGYPVLLKAMKYLKEHSLHNFMLTIIGDGLNRDDYEHTAMEYGISDCVDFKGIISHKQVFEELCQSDIFVLPSYGEALGISYLEAMNCCLPVIGTKNEGISDIIKTGENGLLVGKGDVEGVCNAIEYYVEHPEKAYEIALNGKETVQNMTWKTNAQEMLHCFQEVILNK